MGVARILALVVLTAGLLATSASVASADPVDPAGTVGAVMTVVYGPAMCC
jgi:hypothetical protein